MQRITSLTIVTLLAGMALAGCATNDGDDGAPGGGSPSSATVTATPLTPEVGQPVTFQSNAAASDTANWNFGDGETATGASTSHTYNTPGQYIVTINVTNSA